MLSRIRLRDRMLLFYLNINKSLNAIRKTLLIYNVVITFSTELFGNIPQELFET